MSRLDQHIAAVQNKLALGTFVRALATCAIVFVSLVWLVIIAERMLDRAIPHHLVFFLVGCGVTVGLSLGYAVWRRPSVKATAVAIDQTLGLKEKFSTALYVRPLRDPFAMAAVKDAEREAQNVSLYNRFPIEFPRQAIVVAALAVGAVLTGWLMSPWTPRPNPDLAKENAKAAEAAEGQQKLLAEALPKIEQSVNPMNDNSEAIKAAKMELDKLAKTTEPDANRARLSALQALEGMKKALTEEMDKNEKFQTAMEDKKRLADMDSTPDDSTPMGKAQNDLKKGDLDSAVNEISSAVKNFENQKPEDQKKTVEEAKKLADSLKKVAEDPKVAQQIQQKAQQMGATQQQAQQMTQLMQQAAQGNQQAQQQLQQMAQQVAKNMNNGQGPTQQQQQQISKMLSQMAGIASSQAQAGALAGSAQQVAQAMQKAQGQPGQQSQPGQGQKPGQQGGAGQMAQAQANLQQQLQNMQANAKDAQAMKAGADAAAQAAANAAAGGNPGQGAGQQANGGQPGGNGQSTPGHNPGGQGSSPGDQQAGAGGGGNGKGGGQMPIAEAPFDTTPEIDPGKENAEGQILASRYVKAGIDPGKSTAGLREVAASAEKEAPEDIDPDHFSRDAQEAEKAYFTSMQNTDGK